ncbi:MAG: class I SAM-dependent methyltransferase [Rhizobiaceae bacterium]|nr:class I SAM-dependent methyltransferase [Rhizobiaceae bacterium]
MSKIRQVDSDTLKNVYSKNRTVEDQREIYRKWAETYDAETTGDFGWMGFKPAAEAFAQRVSDRTNRVMDAGCGTGLSGMALAEHGYSNIHGRDLSPEMLAVANKTGVYASLEEADLTVPLDEEPFDAVFACGVFGYGPPHAEHIPHLIDITKPGGKIILTVNGNGWLDMDWENRLSAVVDQHALELKELLDIEYLEKEQIGGKLLVFKA